LEEGEGGGGMSTNNKPLRIIEFKAKSVKAINAIEITPGDRPIVKLTGKNKQGKTSVIDAVWMALSGKSSIPSKPIKEGKEDAEIFLDMGEFIVIRRFTGKGEYLQVQSKDGFKAPRPQEFLSSKLGSRAENPLRFMRLKPDEQVKALQSMVKIEVDPAKFEEITGLPVKGVDLKTDPVSILDQAYKHIYEKRTDINKEVKRLEGSFKSLAGQIPPGSEDVHPVSAAELVKERTALAAKKESNDWQRSALVKNMEKLAALESKVSAIDSEILDLKAKVIKLEEQRKDLISEHQQLDGELAGHRLAIERLVDPDFTEIDARIAGADEANRIAGLIHQSKAAKHDLAETSGDADDLTKRLFDLKTYKHGLIQAAGLPVEGLGFENGEVTFNNFPLSQASGREQIEVSCGICAAENPEIGILTVDIGFSELDKEGQEALATFAKERGLQIWITKVTEEAEADGFHIVSGLLTAVDGVPVETEPFGIIPDPEAIPKAEQGTKGEKPSWM
jgi:hypothetical protein